MASVEPRTHSFVIRIWLEEEPDARQGGRWRGHITHVEDKEPHYLHDLEDVVAYIAPYLNAWGVTLTLRLRLLLWLNQLDRRP